MDHPWLMMIFSNFFIVEFPIPGISRKALSSSCFNRPEVNVIVWTKNLGSNETFTPESITDCHFSTRNGNDPFATTLRFLF